MKLLFLISTLFFKNDSTKTELLNEVVVIVNRSENQVFTTPNSVKILSQKYLRAYAPRSTPEALFGVNGVFVQKTNHGGGSPILRGLTGNQTLILIDGIRLNNSTFRYGPNQYFNTIDPFSIEKIEVLNGGGSVQYGSDALGGTIQVFTKEPEFGSNLNIDLLGRAATQGLEKTARAELGFGTKKIAILGSYGYRNYGDLVGGKLTGRQSPSGYDEMMANFKAKYKVGKGILTASHQFYEARNVPVYHKIKLENFTLNEFSPQMRNLLYLKFDQKQESKIFNKISLVASLQNTYEGRISKKNNAVRRIEEVDKVYSRILTANIHSKLSEIWMANSGIELYHDLVKSKKMDISTQSPESFIQSRGLYPDNATYINFSAFSLHQIALKNWQFSGGLRYNDFVINLEDKDLGQNSIRPSAFVGNFSISRLINDKFHVYLSQNQGFRAPNIDDMGTLGIVDFRYEQPAYDLKPEKSNTFEFGMKYRSSHFSSSVSAFQTQLKDLITRVKMDGFLVNGYPLYQKENTEKARIKGFEAEYEGVFNSSFKTYGMMAYLFGENLSKNEPMRRIPPLNGRTGLEFKQKTLVIRPEFLMAAAQKRLSKGDIDDNRVGKNGTLAWKVFNIHSGVQFKTCFMNLSLQNLFNKDYKTHGSGINGVGRSAVLGINYCF